MRFITGGLLIAIFFVSCSKKSEYILSQKEMANVLTDLHFADAAGVSLTYLHIDSAGLYNWVFKKNNINSAIFDSSIAYYSVHNDKLLNIYNKVQANLAKKETEMKEKVKEETNVKSEIIYESNEMVRLPFDGQMSKMPFDIPIKNKTGEYKIVIRIKLFAVDQSVNPHLTAYFWYDNKTPNGHTEYFTPVTYEKNNRIMSYSASYTVKDSNFTRLKGFILDDDNEEGYFVKHAEIYTVKVSYSPVD